MSWQLKAMEARFEREAFAVRLCIDRPQLGIHVDSVLGESAPELRPLGFTALPVSEDGHERIGESYIRGTDLIVRYDELPNRDVKPSVEWRELNFATRSAAMELRLYTQTSRLQSHPQVEMCTEYPASATMWCLGEKGWQRVAEGEGEFGPSESQGGFLIRLADGGLTYAEFVYPSDYHGARRVIVDGRARLSYRFFTEPLEKGVVRVARVWSLWLPRAGDEQAATSLHRVLCASELPLTA